MYTIHVHTKLLGNEKTTFIVFTNTGIGMIVANHIREKDNEKQDAIIVIHTIL